MPAGMSASGDVLARGRQDMKFVLDRCNADYTTGTTMLMRFDQNNITARQGQREITIVHLTDADRVAAAPYSPAVAGVVLAGKLTLNRALALGRMLGLIERPGTDEARAAGLLQ